METPYDEIMCSGDMVLTLRSNDKLACVHESTSNKLQWNMIHFRTIELESNLETALFFIPPDYTDDIFTVKYRITGAEIINIISSDNSGIALSVNTWNQDETKLEISIPTGLLGIGQINDVFILENESRELDYYPNFDLIDKTGQVVIDVDLTENTEYIEILSGIPLHRSEDHWIENENQKE